MPVETPSPAVNAINPERWVDDHGDYLFAFAVTRLRDPAKAEDLVQETFLAALKGGHRYAGRANERTWLAGILKNKIYDHFRKAGRETSFTDLQFYSDEESSRFQNDGPFKDGWIHELGPIEWSPNPGAALDNEVFWRAFQNCAAKLPKNVAAVFTLREIDAIESKTICTMLNITESNLWVMLHRARMALRTCLEKSWFAKDT